jgi:hypothetical protein
MLAVAGFVPAAASPTATSTICVGLIIDSQSIGGSVSARCVNVRPGTTGVGVLEAAGHRVTFRHDGLLCTIDEVPSSGCDDVDTTHYWSYFHRAPDATAWSYSNENMSTYKPANRSTEGWVYDNGSALKPKNIPASQMCAGLLKPSPSPTPQPAKSHRAVRHTHSPNTPPISTSPTAVPTKPHRRPHHPPRATSAPPDATATPGSESSPSTATVASDTASSSDGGASGGSATGAIIAAAVVAVIAAATVTAARRRRR